jgi:poly(A) polymerase
LVTYQSDAQQAFALEVVKQLRSAGHEAYWAGGCVRDRLLGGAAKDYDVATSARPEEVREIFGRRRTLAIGAAFGVITVLGPKPAGQIEVATFRSDVSYSDGRRPDAVVFSNPQADAQRRDFTINGLFFDPVEDKVLDFVGGQQDLQARIVRAIGDPAERFAEDKLRMLRAVRFAAVLGFAIEEQTATAIRRMATEIAVVSPERIAAELRRMLEHPARRRAVELLESVELLPVILPELQGWSIAQREQTLTVLSELAEPSFPLALAALLWPVVDASQLERIAAGLRLSKKESARASWLVQHVIQHVTALVDAAKQPWPTVQRLLIAEGAADLLNLTSALRSIGVASESDYEFCAAKLQLPSDELNPAPLITGDDLLEQGIRPGKAYQRLLEAVRDAQLERRVTTKAQALDLAKQLHADGNDFR